MCASSQKRSHRLGPLGGRTAPHCKYEGQKAKLRVRPGATMGRNTSFGYAQALLSGLLVCPEAAYSFWVPQGVPDCTSALLITGCYKMPPFLCSMYPSR